MTTKAQQADAELEDLDVREVSIVDRPANRRRFLLIKRDDAGLALEESDMSKSTEHEVVEDEASLLELLGLGLSDDPEVDEPVVDDAAEVDLVEIEKASTVGAVLKGILAMTGALSKAVAMLKSAAEKDAKDIPGAALGTLKMVGKAIGGLLGKFGPADSDAGAEKAPAKEDAPEEDKEAKAKSDLAGVLKAATTALSKLMALSGKVKAMDQKADKLPPEVMAELRSIAAMLAQLEGGKAADAPEKEAPEKAAPAKKQVEFPQIFTTKSEGGENVIIIKAGAKMKKVRLNQFRKAVDTLASLLEEIEGDVVGTKDKAGTSKSVNKTLEDFASKLAETLKESFGKMNEKVDAVSKRVDGLDVTPPGNGDVDTDDAKTIEEVNKNANIWSGII